MRRILFFILLFSLFLGFPSGIFAASLQLETEEESIKIGDVFDAEIVLDTENLETQGVGVRYLNYNPSYLQVKDSDVSSSGVQISPGELYHRTQTNLVDKLEGKIEFVQISSGDETFNGDGILATITFRAIQEGETELFFDFEPGETKDTNVASFGDDILDEADETDLFIGETGAPGDVSNLSVSMVSGGVKILWDNPSGNFEGVRIKKKESDYPFDPYDGETIYEGEDEEYIDYDVESGETYYYGIYAYNGDEFSLGRHIAVFYGGGGGGEEIEISDVNAAEIKSDFATIEWQTGKYASSKVYYGKSEALEVGSVEKQSEVKNHSVTIVDLEVDTKYYYLVESEDDEGNIAQSDIFSFRTLDEGGEQEEEEEEEEEWRQERIAWLRERIAWIIERINYLRGLLSQMEGGEQEEEEEEEEEPLGYTIPVGFRFTKELNYGDRGREVWYLQVFLKNQGINIYPEGKITGYFGRLTKAAVIRFQQKYKEEILAPWGFTRGTGIIGRTTRAKINQLIN